MRTFRVGGGLIVVGNQLLLAANRRRHGAIEWTPPGGVIELHESIATGMSREVHEETGLRVSTWLDCHYSVTVDAPDMQWQMRVESWLAADASGEISLNDPDGIVEQAEFVDLELVDGLLADSPPWVRVPVSAWIANGLRPVGPFAFIVHGPDRSTGRVEQLSP